MDFHKMWSVDIIRCSTMWVTFRGCLLSKFQQDDSVHRVTKSGAWTTNTLFVWSEHDEPNKPPTSTIYSIDLHTGISTPLSFKFDGWIQELHTDGQHLYICTSKRVTIPLKNPNNRQQSVHTKSHAYTEYRLYRVPIGNVESLYFMAAAKVPRSMVDVVKRLMVKHDVPMEVFK